MEGVLVLDSKNDVVFEDKPKVGKMEKDFTGNSERKMLADISNMPRKPSLNQNKKSLPNSTTVKEYIEQLQKENAALMKLVADKNRIIDLSGTELHKLRITLQKMQQQNLQLAQSNSQMLAELNSGKDRLKDLQHKLGCKNGLLIAKQKELEGKRKIRTYETKDNKMKLSENEETGICIVAEKDKDKICNTNARQKSKSLAPSVKKVQEKSVCDNGRLRGRRQSARFNHEEPKPKEDVFDTNNIDQMQEDDNSNSAVISVKKEDDNSLPNKITQENRRSSISRPSRVAATKVQSYKEISLHVKMRRPE